MQRHRTSLVACGADHDGHVIACREVVDRLVAADRDERALGIDTTELRRRAEQIARTHVAELQARRLLRDAP